MVTESVSREPDLVSLKMYEVPCYQLDDQGIVVRFPAGEMDFLSAYTFPTGIEGPHSFPFNGYRGSFAQDRATGA
jgi:hypothetical protein